MIETIVHKKKLFAMILNEKKYKKKGIEFITPNHFNIQVGFINHDKNHIIVPHIHKNYLRKIKRTTEVIFVKKGVLRVDFYDSKKKYLFSKVLKKNNIIILVEGSHGFKVLKKCSLIEVKQGPFRASMDKDKFKEIIEEKEIKIRK